MTRAALRRSRQRSEQRRLVQLEARFLPFLLAVLIMVFVMPLANPFGSLPQRLTMPLLVDLTVVASIRMLPVIRPSGRAALQVGLYRLTGLLAGLLVWIPALAGGWPLRSLRIVTLVLLALFFLLTSVRLVRLLARVPRVNLQVLAGAAAGYAHLGLTGGLVATAIQVIHPGSFNLGVESPNEFLLDRLTYFSFVTLAGLGYGDVLPANPIGERIVILLSLASTLYVSILLGLLMGRFLASQEMDLILGERARNLPASDPPPAPDLLEGEGVDAAPEETAPGQ